MRATTTEMDDEAFAYLSKICDQSPHELRGMAYDLLPESLTQLKRWKRRDLIPFLFDFWLKRREARAEGGP